MVLKFLGDKIHKYVFQAKLLTSEILNLVIFFRCRESFCESSDFCKKRLWRHRRRYLGRR